MNVGRGEEEINREAEPEEEKEEIGGERKFLMSYKNIKDVTGFSLFKDNPSI